MPDSGEKRGRGRPRKEQSEVDQPSNDQVLDQSNSGALKVPNKRPGRKQPGKAVAEEATFDVPDDSPIAKGKPGKSTKTRKPPQRAAHETTTDAATGLETGKKKLANQVQQAKANAIKEPEESLDGSGQLGEATIEDHAVDESSHVTDGQGVPQANDEAINLNNPENNMEFDPAVDFDPSYVPGHAPVDEERQDNLMSEVEMEGHQTAKSARKGKRAEPSQPMQSYGSPNPSDGNVAEIEVFGRHLAWEKMLTGAREVGVSKIKGKPHKEVPRLETNTVKGLVELIKDAISIYEQVHSRLESGITDDDLQYSEERLAAINQQVFEIAEDFSEESAGAKRGEMAQDIYAHAIPNMVYWLRAALRSRTEFYQHEDDITYLQEVIRMQDLLVITCEKVKQWKVKVPTDRPITNSTLQLIAPYLRDLRKAFQEQLEHRERLLRNQSNEDALAQSHQRRKERLERQKQLNQRKRADQRTKIMNSLRNNPTPYRKRPNAPNPSQAYPGVATFNYQPSPSMIIDSWSTEQDTELINQLLRDNIKYLQGEFFLSGRCMRVLTIVVAPERYLAILNAPSLQNKLPEHIRERALYYKDIMLQDLGPQEYILNIE